MTTDQAFQQLRAAGWSAGDALIGKLNSSRWQVYCHRGEQKLVATAEHQSEAWVAAARLAASLDAELGDHSSSE